MHHQGKTRQIDFMPRLVMLLHTALLKLPQMHHTPPSSLRLDALKQPKGRSKSAAGCMCPRRDIGGILSSTGLYISAFSPRSQLLPLIAAEVLLGAEEAARQRSRCTPSLGEK